MKTKYIADLQDRDSITSEFLVKTLSVQMAKNGKPYMNLILMDRTGEIESRIWENAEEAYRVIKKNGFIRADGKISLYQGRKQFILTNYRVIQDSEVDLQDFVAVSGFDINAMYAEVEALVASMRDPDIKKLAETLLFDEAVRKGFREAPAAKGVHHAYAGGLLEHVLSVTRLVEFFCRHYGSGIRRDLAIFGGLFHDIGKLYEFDYGKSTDYTDEGRLVGHLIIGSEIIEKLCSSIPGFPDHKRTHIKHIILSHHGEYEYGSPKRPKTMEALFVSKADDLDSKVNTIQSFMAKDETEGEWTGYHKMYERFFFKGEIGPYSPDLLSGEEAPVKPMADLSANTAAGTGPAPTAATPAPKGKPGAPGTGQQNLF
jgi:3'-5' exoribonuclease